MLDAQGQHIRLNHARDYLRQHFAIDAGLDNMDFRPLGSNPKLVDDDTRAHCREQMSACRERAHETLAGLIAGAKITVWRETDDGGLSVVAPTWASAVFDEQGDQRADKLYFETSDWNMLLTQLTSAESRRYFAEQGTNPPTPSFAEQSVAERPGRRASADKTAKIALIVELTTRDAKDTLGRELAAYSAQLALNNTFENSRRWIGLSDRLVKAGRSYIDELAMKIRSFDAGSAAGATYTESVKSFVAHLGSIFDDHWAKDAPWRRNKDAPAPSAWQSEKAQLELALQVQQSEFEDEPEPISISTKGPQWKRFGCSGIASMRAWA